MRRAALTRGALAALAALAAGALAGSGCSCDGDPTGDDDGDQRTFDECAGGAASFVRQAFLALDGRRPRSQAEVDVYVDLYDQAVAQERDPIELVARAIMNRPEFAARWIDVVMDALSVQRIDIQGEASCWDQPARQAVAPALAAAIRDGRATGGGDGAPFTMLDLAASAIALDDLTPIYRAQLFSLVSHPQPAANVGRVEAELARRADFGATFDASWLHRDTVCLGCHTSDASVTDRDDPDHDRHWPVPGAPELAVYGNALGISAERAHAPFRVDGFVDEGNVRPWGWSAACGTFASPASLGDDPAAVDGKLASVTGRRGTVYDLEAALARGFAALRADGAPTGPIADPDTALAWLVTLKITEDVWRQVTGTTLTISNYFPRNEAASELLYALASELVASGYSLKALLVRIVASDYFDRLPPDARCGPSPYTYPPVFDPWVIADADPLRQGNGPGDAVTAADARTLLGAAAAALEWGPPPLASRFPDYGEPRCDELTCQALQSVCNGQGACCTTYAAACQQPGVLPLTELPFLRGVGVFLRNSERGFRGLDFQARLAWQDRHGACAKPRWVEQDFVDRLAAAGAADAEATAHDAIAALKDRLVGEPGIAEGAEADALAAIVGALDGPAAGVGADALRRVCGALLESPQFLLQGIAGRGGERPRLTPADAGYDHVCGELAASGLGVAGAAVTCTPGERSCSRPRAPPHLPRRRSRARAGRARRRPPPRPRRSAPRAGADRGARPARRGRVALMAEHELASIDEVCAYLLLPPWPALRAELRRLAAASARLGTSPHADLVRLDVCHRIRLAQDAIFAAAGDPVPAYAALVARAAAYVEAGLALPLAEGAPPGERPPPPEPDDADDDDDDVRDVTATHYGRLWGGFSPAHYFDEATALLRARFERNDVDLSRASRQRVLDAGCGGGRYAVALRRLGFAEVVGVDWSAEGIEVANARVADAGIIGVSYRRADVLALPFERGEFDVVFSNGVLHHTVDPARGLAELRRVAAPGGLGWIYLYARPGGLDRLTHYLARFLLRGASHETCRRYCGALGLAAHRTFFLLDLWLAPRAEAYTPAEAEAMLAAAGFPSHRRAARGSDQDLVEQLHRGAPFAADKYGVGENRYVIET